MFRLNYQDIHYTHLKQLARKTVDSFHMIPNWQFYSVLLSLVFSTLYGNQIINNTLLVVSHFYKYFVHIDVTGFIIIYSELYLPYIT